MEQIQNLRQFIANTKQYSDRYAVEENIKGVFIKRTYKDFLYDIREVASLLLESNIKGQNIAIVGANSYRWLVSFFGVVLSNNVAVPIDNNISQTELDELVYRLNIHHLFMSETCLQRIYEIDGVQTYSFDAEIRCNSIISEEELLSYDDKLKDQVACIILTSGTSGYNKAVMLTHRNICKNMESVIDLCVVTRPEGYLVSSLPMYHSYELCCNTLPSIWFGRTLVIDLDIRNYIPNLIKYKPETHVIVPSILNFLSKKVDAFGDLRFNIVVGGAALDKAVYKKMVYAGFKVYVGYGMSEASPLIAVKRDYDEDVDACELFFTNIKINNRNGEKEGEILIKGDNITPGYYKDEEATKQSFTEDGWFKTGDLGYIENNKLHFTGRLKNTIILDNGKNVQPEQIEQIIYDNLAYVDDVVVTEMTVNNNPCIGAIFYSSYVNLLNDPDKIINDIKELNKKLEPHQKITNIAVSPEVLPKNKILKIIRKSVKEHLKEYRSFTVR